MNFDQNLIAPSLGVLGLLIVVIIYQWIKKQDGGSGAVKKIGEQIHIGAIVFMKREYKMLSIFALVLLVLLYIFLGAASALCFVVGALTSATAGYIGMNTATIANVRTAQAAHDKGSASALTVAFFGGSVMGLSVAALGLLGLGGLYYFFGAEHSEALHGFAMGASVVALFSRVGGGIFTKSADVGADLVGKLEAGIPEDDPRNPAVIADNVGDNVGDVAGLGADLFESYVGATVAAVPLGINRLGYSGAALPFWISGAGIICSIIGTFMINIGEEGHSDKTALQEKLLMTLRKGTLSAGILVLAVTIPICLNLFNEDTTIAWELWGCSTIGLVSGVLVGWVTEYTTSDVSRPTQTIAEAAETGPATVIIRGFGVGMISTCGPGFILAMAALVTARMQGPYGVAIAAIGMLSTLGITLATDAYGPVADNAGGIAEMAELDERVRDNTDALDALGNTTAATGKGFAIGSALLITLALVSTFVDENIDDDGNKMILDMTDELTLAGGLIGAMLPFLFGAMTMFAVEKSARALIIEVRRQFREIDGLREGREGVVPQSQECVAICTAAAIREMIPPGLIACLAPLCFGFTFGAEFLGGMLIGSIFSGFFLGTTMANAGGAWDNAKKYCERGALNDPDQGITDRGKGSAWHKAVVVGDTVGDPFKDTSGPALNILSKLMAHLSLIISGELKFGFDNWYIGIIIFGVSFVIAGITFVWYEREIEKEQQATEKLNRRQAPVTVHGSAPTLIGHNDFSNDD
jgi:K(+)-stimulated pyrophosphate-energized sodium pump